MQSFKLHDVLDCLPTKTIGEKIRIHFQVQPTGLLQFYELNNRNFQVRTRRGKGVWEFEAMKVGYGICCQEKARHERWVLIQAIAFL